MADIFTAIKWLSDGNKVRRKSWIQADSFIKLEGSIIVSHKDKPAYFMIDHFYADDWEIYEPWTLGKNRVEFFGAKSNQFDDKAIKEFLRLLENDLSEVGMTKYEIHEIISKRAGKI